MNLVKLLLPHNMDYTETISYVKEHGINVIENISIDDITDDGIIISLNENGLAILDDDIEIIDIDYISLYNDDKLMSYQKDMVDTIRNVKLQYIETL